MKFLLAVFFPFKSFVFNTLPRPNTTPKPPHCGEHISNPALALGSAYELGGDPLFPLSSSRGKTFPSFSQASPYLPHFLYLALYLSWYLLLVVVPHSNSSRPSPRASFFDPSFAVLLNMFPRVTPFCFFRTCSSYL